MWVMSYKYSSEWSWVSGEKKREGSRTMRVLRGYVTSLLLLSLKLELARPQLLKIRVCELNKG